MNASEFELDLGLPPRNGGLTHVIDKGLGPRAVEDLLETAGAYIDIVKLGWGTGAVTPNLAHKLELYRAAGKPVVCGGTFFEVVFAQDKLDEYRSWLTKHGFAHVEISDGVVEMPRERKLELIAELARDFTVLSEVGSKDAEVVFAPYQWVEWITEELAAGAWKVITEGREGGTAGIYRPSGEMRTGLVDEIVHGVEVSDVDLRGADEGVAGVVRAALRFRSQPRQHPARRGDPARDAAPRPPRGHPEGGAAWKLSPARIAIDTIPATPRSSQRRGADPRRLRALRRPALPDVLVAEAVVRARAHGRRAGRRRSTSSSSTRTCSSASATRRASGWSSATASS